MKALLETSSPTYLRRMAREINARIQRGGTVYYLREINRVTYRIVSARTYTSEGEVYLIIRPLYGSAEFVCYQCGDGALSDGCGNQICASRAVSRSADNRKARDEAAHSLGLVKVRGALGGTYYE
jgi:hypothetical protein